MPEVISSSLRDTEANLKISIGCDREQPFRGLVDHEARKTYGTGQLRFHAIDSLSIDRTMSAILNRRTRSAVGYIRGAHLDYWCCHCCAALFPFG